MAEWRPAQFRLAGGMNEEDPQFTLPPGAAAFMQNYECLPGAGYRRIGGYERFAGTFWADEQVGTNTYAKIAFTHGTLEPTTFGINVQSTSGSINAVLVAVELTSGDWGSGNAAGYFVVTEYADLNTAAVGDNLVAQSTGLIFGSISGNTLIYQALDDANYAEWKQLALDWHRAHNVANVGGPDTGSGVCTGPIQGVFSINNKVYAWRSSKADPTKIKLINSLGYFAQIEISPMPYLPFDNGTAEINIGDTVTDHTTGATGTVHEINIAEGNFAGPTFAAGRLFVTNITGGVFADNNEIWVGGAKKALVNGAMTTPTPSSGTQLARHKTVITNFYGSADRMCVYGCDGYNDPYVFDGTYLMYFSNTMTTFPQYIEVHRNHLFFAYPGGSIQNSATGLPLVWSVRQGAAEIGIGDEPQGMVSGGNNTLAITSTKSVHLLTGTSDQDWSVRTVTDALHPVASTIAGVGGATLFLDHAGLSKLLPTPPYYQDYTTQQVSKNVRKTIEKRADDALFAMSLPKKQQYRLFFDDGTFLIGAFFADQLVGFSMGKYPVQMTCGVTATVTDMIGITKTGEFMGTADGYVVFCDYGPSFAGEPIQSILQTPFCYHRVPDRDKRFHKLTLEMETPATIDLRVHTDFDYGTGSQTGNFVAATGATGGQWDISKWEAFFWDSGVLTAPETNIDGIGRNISFTFAHETRTAEPFVLSAALLQFSLYGVKR